MFSSAKISDCKKYRYRLDRGWDESKDTVMFLMLNPSTADGTVDDRTIKRCINFAMDWGYGGLMVGNLFALRTPYPHELLDSDDPIGPENQVYLDQMYKQASMLICAWGNGSLVTKLGAKHRTEYMPLKSWVGLLHYLALAKDGTPKHPLYLPKGIKPMSYGIIYSSLLQ